MTRHLLGALGASTLLLGGVAHAQTPTFLLRLDDPFGTPPRVVIQLQAVDANAVGGFALGLRTHDGTTELSHFWGNVGSGSSGALLRTEAAGLAGFDQTSFDPPMGFSDSGALCYVAVSTPVGGGSPVRGLWLDSAPILSEGDSPATEPGLFCSNVRYADVVAHGSEPVWVSMLEDIVGFSDGDRLHRGAGHAVLLSSGPPAPPPLSGGIHTITSKHGVSSGGTHWISEVDVDPTAGFTPYLVVDGVVATTCAGTLVGEGEPIPTEAGGLVGEDWNRFVSVAINEAGRYLCAGTTTAPSATDGVLAIDGSVVLREGDVVRDLANNPHTLFGQVDFAAMNEDGDVLAIWDVDALNNEALLVNGVVVLIAGDEVDWDGDSNLDAAHTVFRFPDSDSGDIGPRSGGQVRIWVRTEVDVPSLPFVSEGLMTMQLAAPDLLVPAECSPFDSLCNGDGGDGMGCTACPCGNDAPATTVGGCLNSAGTSARLDATGSASVSLPSGSTLDLRFTMTGGPAAATSVLLSGSAVAPTNMAHPCFGLASGIQAPDRDGLRCAVMSLLRHGNRQTDGAGTVAAATGPSRVWGGEAQPTAGIAGAAGFVAGQTRVFQVTHRDDPLLVCMRGLNTTQAIEVVFEP